MPRFFAIFEDFDVALPALTLAIIYLPGLMVFAAMLFLAAGLVLKELIPGLDHKAAVTVDRLALGFALFLMVTYIVAMLLPLLSLQQ